MSTTGKIEVDGSRKEYFVDSDAYPEEMVPYLEGIVSRARTAAREKYNSPGELWQEELERRLLKKTEGQYSELSVYNHNAPVNYYYRITEDGSVLVKSNPEDDWSDPNE